VLQAAGTSIDNVVKVNVFLSDMGDFAAMNEVYKLYWGDVKPSRTCVAAKQLPFGTDVEVECVAVLPVYVVPSSVPDDIVEGEVRGADGDPGLGVSCRWGYGKERGIMMESPTTNENEVVTLWRSNTAQSPCMRTARGLAHLYRHIRAECDAADSTHPHT